MAAPSGEISVTCDDFLEFQEALKKFRTIDDKIVYQLNTAIPTSSFADKVNAGTQCKSLYEELSQGHVQRENAIRKCIQQVSQQVAKLRQARETDHDNINLLKQLRKEQTKLRLMQQEMNVEEVVRDRSLKIFQERCRTFYKPPASS
ncbi:protein MIX23-like [Branchiostoma floridae x Branchiostoma belcheri]|nr:Coiled-coil domain-containing protein 58 [Branchiostoma belcheri]